MNVWFVVLNYEGWDDTRACLNSVEATGRPVVLVDNGSNVNHLDELGSPSWCHPIRLPHNHGTAGGFNVGARYALQHGAEWVIWLNNDTVVAPDLVDRLEAAASARPDLHILGPLIRDWDGESVQTRGHLFDPTGAEGYFVEPPAATGVSEVDIVNGCCIMVSKAVFLRVGLLDERLFVTHEESDLCLRARDAGLRCGVLNEPLVRHHGSATFRREGTFGMRYHDARNLWLLVQRFGARRRRRVRYLRNVYWQYCRELDNGRPQAARAVAEGLADALRGRFGARSGRSDAVVSAVDGAFKWARWCDRR